MISSVTYRKIGSEFSGAILVGSSCMSEMPRPCGSSVKVSALSTLVLESPKALQMLGGSEQGFDTGDYDSGAGRKKFSPKQKIYQTGKYSCKHESHERAKRYWNLVVKLQLSRVGHFESDINRWHVPRVRKESNIIW